MTQKAPPSKKPPKGEGEPGDETSSWGQSDDDQPDETNDQPDDSTSPEAPGPGDLPIDQQPEPLPVNPPSTAPDDPSPTAPDEPTPAQPATPNLNVPTPPPSNSPLWQIPTAPTVPAQGTEVDNGLPQMPLQPVVTVGVGGNTISVGPTTDGTGGGIIVGGVFRMKRAWSRLRGAVLHRPK